MLGDYRLDQTRIAAVFDNGMVQDEQGRTLRIIGNNDVYVGGYYFTDGRFLYGNKRDTFGGLSPTVYGYLFIFVGQDYNTDNCRMCILTDGLHIIPCKKFSFIDEQYNPPCLIVGKNLCVMQEKQNGRDGDYINCILPNKKTYNIAYRDTGLGGSAFDGFVADDGSVYEAYAQKAKYNDSNGNIFTGGTNIDIVCTKIEQGQLTSNIVFSTRDIIVHTPTKYNHTYHNAYPTNVHIRPDGSYIAVYVGTQDYTVAGGYSNTSYESMSADIEYKIYDDEWNLVDSGTRNSVLNSFRLSGSYMSRDNEIRHYDYKPFVLWKTRIISNYNDQTESIYTLYDSSTDVLTTLFRVEELYNSTTSDPSFYDEETGENHGHVWAESYKSCISVSDTVTKYTNGVFHVSHNVGSYPYESYKIKTVYADECIQTSIGNSFEFEFNGIHAEFIADITNQINTSHESSEWHSWVEKDNPIKLEVGNYKDGTPIYTTCTSLKVKRGRGYFIAASQLETIAAADIYCEFECLGFKYDGHDKIKHVLQIGEKNFLILARSGLYVSNGETATLISADINARYNQNMRISKINNTQGIAALCASVRKGGE